MPVISQFYGILIYICIVLHKDELHTAWYALNNDGEVIKIKGLE